MSRSFTESLKKMTSSKSVDNSDEGEDTRISVSIPPELNHTESKFFEIGAIINNDEQLMTRRRSLSNVSQSEQVDNGNKRERPSLSRF